MFKNNNKNIPQGGIQKNSHSIYCLQERLDLVTWALCWENFVLVGSFIQWLEISSLPRYFPLLYRILFLNSVHTPWEYEQCHTILTILQNDLHFIILRYFRSIKQCEQINFSQEWSAKIIASSIISHSKGGKVLVLKTYICCHT